MQGTPGKPDIVGVAGRWPPRSLVRADTKKSRKSDRRGDAEGLPPLRTRDLGGSALPLGTAEVPSCDSPASPLAPAGCVASVCSRECCALGGRAELHRWPCERGADGVIAERENPGVSALNDGTAFIGRHLGRLGVVSGGSGSTSSARARRGNALVEPSNGRLRDECLD